jgi:gluconate kinase
MHYDNARTGWLPALAREVRTTAAQAVVIVREAIRRRRRDAAS